MEYYYIQSVSYTKADLCAADKFVLEKLGGLCRNIVVTDKWCEGLLKFLSLELNEFYFKNKRAKTIDLKFHVEYSHYLQLGNIHIMLFRIHSCQEYFSPPMFQADEIERK